MTTLLWFQHDLRLKDNAAFNHALLQGGHIIAVYIHSPQEDAPWAAGAASRWWLHHSLVRLQDELQRLDIELQFFHGESRKLIPELADFYHVTTVTWTGRHEPQRRTHEQAITASLELQNIDVKTFTDELLSQPDQFLTRTGQTPYRVFTPFYKRLRAELQLTPQGPTEPPSTRQTSIRIDKHAEALQLDQLQLPDIHQWHNKLHSFWTPGEAGASYRLNEFIDNTLRAYPDQRDYPAISGTSGLSAHLHFGEISPAQILDALTPLIEFGDARLRRAAEVFLRQLIWREFTRYILFHYPETTTEPMNKKFTSAFWITDPDGLKDWQQGKTGIPIIDAGMRQLWETGSMHNRVRMLVASLLTKNMGVRWQYGAQWFWETLVDADLANNTMGWQWVAGCGVDAAPYYRIFNPETQTKRFDARHGYITHWLKPHEVKQPKAISIRLAADRQHALDRYNNMIRRPEQP